MLNNLVSQPIPIRTWKMEPQKGSSDQVSCAPETENSVLSNKQNQDDVGSQKSLLPAKRKASIEPLSLAEKRATKMEPNMNSPRSSQLSALNKRHAQSRVQTPKSRTAPQEVSPKVQSGSFEAVRSKMRETLAAALAVGSPNQEKALTEDNNNNSSNNYNTKNNNNNSPVEADVPPGETSSGSAQNLHQTRKSDKQEPQYNYVMPDADGAFGDTFFVKDELLQGNGLSWAWDMEVSDLKEVQVDEKPNTAHIEGKTGAEKGQSDSNANGDERVFKSPQELASKIESELFKLFGGVNKKYKEKGRSLMFNLKDRNNPDLRERVLSGAISPERLCSMTPEELASKELSEWRMAKAEELDKMIVLPDSDVDIRRLVKKTHKGEYQVEVEQDDAVSVEVSVGSTSLTRFQPKKKMGNVSLEGDKSSSENLDPASSLTIPADGTDFMQELISDEFKDEGFLPPIVSLDEFMESLDSEPPFENLPVDSKENKAIADKGDSETVKVSSSASGGKTDQKIKATEAFLNMKTRKTPMERKALPAASVAVGEQAWVGELQLSISSSISVIGLFRSGEKTSTKEWPSSMEIKGRVRLDAFEKFLQELPMSRSRAVMVVHFILKDSSSEIHRTLLSEAVDSYIGDERLGFGEPNPGVELYFCPPHTRIIEMLSRHLSKDRTDILKPTDNGLIGVVVWRRPQISSLNSPSSLSHHKHHKTHNPPTRKHENINTNHRPAPQPNNDVDDDEDDDIPPGFGPGAPAAAREEDDLPEFSFSGRSNSSGQKTAARAGSGPKSNQANPSRPVDEMRKLIYRYGQNQGGGARQWNQDDDDMPEWQPQLPPPPPPPELPPMHNVQQRPLRPSHVAVNQIRPLMGQVRPLMPMQPPGNVRWVATPPGAHGLPPNAAIPGPHYGGQWRQDAPRSRGF